MRINKVFLNNLAILHPRMLCAELIEIEHVVLAKNIHLHFHNSAIISPLNIVEDTLCRVWLNLAHGPVILEFVNVS